MTNLDKAQRLAASAGNRHQRRLLGIASAAANWPEPIAIPADIEAAAATLVAVMSKELPVPTAPTPTEYLSAKGGDLLSDFVVASVAADAAKGARHQISLVALADLVATVERSLGDLWAAIERSYATAFAAQLSVDLEAPSRIPACDWARLTSVARSEVETARRVLAVLAAAGEVSGIATRLSADASVVEQVARFVKCDWSTWQQFRRAQRPGLVLNGPLLLELAKAKAEPSLARSRAEIDRRVADLEQSRASAPTSLGVADRNREAAALATARDIAAMRPRNETA